MWTFLKENQGLLAALGMYASLVLIAAAFALVSPHKEPEEPLLYWRDSADGQVLVCRECERVTGDSAASCRVTLVRIQGAVHAYCERCGAKQRLNGFELATEENHE